MDQQTNSKLKTDFLISNDAPLSHPIQTTLEPKFKKCNECKRRRKVYNRADQICYQCYKAKKVPLSGNKVIDDFIKYTLTNYCKKEGGMEFVPYDRFKDVEFIAEGGFSKIYKAIWIDGPINNWNEDDQKHNTYGTMTVALKELDKSENINSKELNELKIYYDFVLKWKPNKGSRSFNIKKDPDETNDYYLNLSYHNKVNIYYGITQNPITKNFMIIIKYYKSGDLTHYIADDFFSHSWVAKLKILQNIISGLKNIHDANIIHKDYHSGNIFYNGEIGDLGLSKSAIESLDDDNEIYGVIPYIAPEVLQKEKYTKASDIYSFSMIMWELMTGRKPFWDRSHDTELIIEISCGGLRPPIVTNAPEGYIELMKECWHSDPNKRPTATEIYEMIKDILWCNDGIFPSVIASSDIGPITNNPNAIYESRPLSAMIKSVELTRSLKIERSLYCQNNYKTFNGDKRKFDNSIEDTENNNDNGYLTRELEFDIEDNINPFKSNKNNYSTKEINFDI
ncbi:hypothetical protein RclHR1_04880004 [Rhizophagus clarus]|uniref:Kinase-like domain-containing protein n=1 Tax=Rhizophagus clarus TaxID=94130 RepID=A0A2Z6SDG2_9GLOM|nr:hypothetical protein RclHR1_04880004 [Rhizophagus clarus]GES92936.1 kinase-like domain-containing protein [Rhizophagus clarus]